ncbi:phenylacetic acid degradation bifunctional protein PaaZ [Pseudonocardia sp. K10HN5]|uniref:Phenylacetic acid degradation bifunctional protein PaaZ n=1 Tax=Pseudonocardia acidicola TaxID=2724939 RepID=A0ABX1SPF1_9PSEU|nr:phenylacetic acid degradation bifunctional protein PaaZ [Pseudonocardia acidicola]
MPSTATGSLSASRELTFHQRADLLKALAAHLREQRPAFYELSARTGATLFDSKFDVDGGIAVLGAYAALGRDRLPDATILVEDEPQRLSKAGDFLARHVAVPLHGVAVQINAYNFPVWGMLEKRAPALLAGVPSIVKPATQTAYLAELVVRSIIGSGILPEGALQFVAGSVGDLLDHLTPQDLVSFTGSAATGQRLRTHPAVVTRSVRFNAEPDSLNCSILGPDTGPGTPEFDLYVGQLVTEMTVKAGQKCTAIRRALVPREHVDAVIEATRDRLGKVVVGNPRSEGVTMGALAGLQQREEVRCSLKALTDVARVVAGDPNRFGVVDADPERGAFLPPILLHCADNDRPEPHEVEAFGPVSTVLGYDGLDDAVRLAARGQGSLAGSVVTHNPEVARAVVLGLAPWHGRVLVLDREGAKGSTGHGSPLPGLVHGGPGRAGGGAELGGLHGVLHHMQRTAVQAGPTLLGAVAGERA